MLKKFNQLIALLTVGTLPVAIAGCSDKREATPHECKKYPAWHINPSKPVPKPEPKPKPIKDEFIKILKKHSVWFDPFILEWKDKLFEPKISDEIVRKYLIANLAPKLKYDYSKVSFIGGTESAPGHQSIHWVRIMPEDFTKITALFVTTPHHQVGIDFWVKAEIKF